jgi:hypothetical protein
MSLVEGLAFRRAISDFLPVVQENISRHGLAVWFIATPYQYFIVGSGNTLVRVHRFTGEAERLGGSGWRRMTQGDL